MYTWSPEHDGHLSDVAKPMPVYNCDCPDMAPPGSPRATHQQLPVEALPVPESFYWDRMPFRVIWKWFLIFSLWSIGELLDESFSSTLDNDAEGDGGVSVEEISLNETRTVASIPLNINRSSEKTLKIDQDIDDPAPFNNNDLEYRPEENREFSSDQENSTIQVEEVEPKVQFTYPLYQEDFE